MIRVVRMHFKQEHIEDFKQLFESRKELIRNFEGCTYLELWQDEADASIFYTYSIWKQSSDLECYRMSDLFQDTWSCVKKWFHDSPKAFSANKLIQLP
jgi:quinol monooxygenase YgiN